MRRAREKQLLVPSQTSPGQYLSLRPYGVFFSRPIGKGLLPNARMRGEKLPFAGLPRKMQLQRSNPQRVYRIMQTLPPLVQQHCSRAYIPSPSHVAASSRLAEVLAGDVLSEGCESWSLLSRLLSPFYLQLDIPGARKLCERIRKPIVEHYNDACLQANACDGFVIGTLERNGARVLGLRVDRDQILLEPALRGGKTMRDPLNSRGGNRSALKQPPNSARDRAERRPAM